MKIFRLGEWRYVDAGGNQLWREKDCWYIGGVKLKNPTRDIDPLSIADFKKAEKEYLSKVLLNTLVATQEKQQLKGSE